MAQVTEARTKRRRTDEPPPRDASAAAGARDAGQQSGGSSDFGAATPTARVGAEPGEVAVSAETAADDEKRAQNYLQEALEQAAKAKSGDGKSSPCP